MNEDNQFPSQYVLVIAHELLKEPVKHVQYFVDSESEPILTGPGNLVSFFVWGKSRPLSQQMEGYNRHKASFPRTKPANTARPCAGPARSPSSPSVPPKGFRP
ncbi:hypothetical protein THAOC_23920, partial [Thalassiosira oceanica]